MKKTIAIIVLSIVAAIGFFFAIIMTANSTDNYGKMYDAQSTNTALQNTATAFANDKNVYEAQLVVTLESVETDNSTLQDQLNATECANQPKYIDYTSNATVSIHSKFGFKTIPERASPMPPTRPSGQTLKLQFIRYLGNICILISYSLINRSSITPMKFTISPILAGCIR